MESVKRLILEARLAGLENNERGLFIGLVDTVFDDPKPTNGTSRFDWVDGTEFDFGSVGNVDPWAFDQPNNFGDEQEDCVE